MCSATALAQPAATTGPSGSAEPIDPYDQPGQPVDPCRDAAPPAAPAPAAPAPSPPAPAPAAPAPSPAAPAPSPAAPAPSQDQAPARSPAPDTQPVDKPASEERATPDIDKPAPAPVDTPAPVKDKQAAADAESSVAPPERVDPPVPDATGPVAPAAPVIDVAAAPPTCRDSGTLAQSRDRDAALPAKISFAICTADAALAPLQLVDAEASVHDVDRATANSFALLDEAAAAGDPRWQIVALHAEGDLLATMTKRMMGTVPAGGSAELHDMRLQMLQPHLRPWIERAQKAFTEVDRLARANPQLMRNQVVARAVTDSRARMAAGVATR